MANGAETEEFVVLSKVRSGLKREFAFCIKAHNEGAGSLGRTRARTNSNGGVQESSLETVPQRVKKAKKSSSAEEEQDVEEEGEEEEEKEGEEDVEVEVKESNGEGVVDDKLDVDDVVSGDEEEGKIGEKSGEVEEELTSDVVDPTSDDDVRCQSSESSKENAGPALVASDGEQKADTGMEDLPSRVNTETVESEKVVIHSGDAEILAEQEAMEVDTQEVPIGSEKDGDGATATAMTKKVLLKMIPTRLKDLLETGLLEGMTVRYVRGCRAKITKEAGLQGVITGIKVYCYCAECNGTTAVTPNQFELHAGSANKRPVDYMYLENGTSLRDVLNACKGSNLDDLEAVINNAIGGASERKILFRPKELVARQESPQPVTVASISRPREAAGRKSYASSKKSCSSGSKSSAKVTRKFLGLHKSALQDDVLPDGTEVGYYSNGQKLLTGYKRGSRIFCMHCQTEVSPSQFEAHAGMASRRKPYLHIYTSNGVSLHELSVRLNKSQSLSTMANDEACRVCSESGYLLCCDGCPRAFHLECIQLSSTPEGEWFCRYCKDMYEREKYAERNANAIAAGRVAGVDPVEQITSRCIRSVKIEDSESGGCALCRAHDFARGGFGPRTVIICDQCEKEYHVGCLRSHGIQNLKEVPKEAWFCCNECNSIHSSLQKLLQDGALPLPDHLVDSIKEKYAENGLGDESLDIKWRLLSGKMSSVSDIRNSLAKAVSIFHEQFDPIMFPGSTHDMIPHMIYGRSAKGMDFGGMYCAVLTVNSVTVSVGIFRVLGNEVAELPLAATASNCKKMGYFQALFTCIEKLLGDLNVKDMWLPAAEEVKSFWTDKFGFLEFPMSEFKERKKKHNVMIFDGTLMLRKDIPKPVKVEE